jgi:hypothetical protein
MAISKKLRFEVFKRDKFTCQYCGKKAPDVVLHADHIEPKSNGGTDTLLNLTTACESCNLGKGARRLSDDSAVIKQRTQLDELQAKQEQIAMMVEWQRSLAGMETEGVAQAADFWHELVGCSTLTDYGKKRIRRLIKQHGLEAVFEAMRIATSQYITMENGWPTKESVDLAFQKIGGVCRVRAAEVDKPWLQQVLYIRGIIKNRLYYVNPSDAKKMLERAFEAGADGEYLRSMALEEHNWTNWCDAMWSYIDQLEGDDA